MENFDDEQIWQEIELQNDPILKDLVGDIAAVSVSKTFHFGIDSNEKKKKEKRKSKTKDVEMESDSEGEGEGNNDFGNELGADNEEDEEDSLEELNIDVKKYRKESTSLFGSLGDGEDESEEEKELEKLLDKATGEKDR